MQNLQVQARALTIDGTNYLLAAGTSDVNSEAVDMSGFRDVAFIVMLGTLAASSTVTCKVQESANNSDWADVASSSTGALADTQDNKTIILSLTDVAKRYYRVVTTRGDAGNSTINALVALVGGPRHATVGYAAHSTNASTKVLVGPVAGTA
jgi:hypothetical protein